MRRLRGPIGAVVVVGAVCAAMIGVAIVFWPRGGARVEVVVDHNGVRRSALLRGHPTVEMALAAVGIRLASAHVLTARSHQPIARHNLAPALFLNSTPTTPVAVLVSRHNHLLVIDAHDTVESVVTKAGAAIPAPPLPRVVRKLWHPGLAGVATQATVGAISGEVSAQVSIEPSAPTPVTDKVVALTFDDGPSPDTPQFLQVLKQAGVKATFCMIGRQVVAHPEWVRAVAAAGMTLCNHTQNHDEHIDRAGPSLVQAEIQGGADALGRVLGKAPTFYRPPAGTLSPLIEDDAHRLGEQVLGWSVDPSDYEKPGTEKILTSVMAQVQPGAIILLHDGGGDRTQTLAALPRIIAELKAQGYSFTTPDAISPATLGMRPPAPPVLRMSPPV